MAKGREILNAAIIRDFLKFFNIETDPFLQTEAFIRSLAAIDPRYENGRNLVRFQLEGIKPLLTEEALDKVMSAARILRITEEKTLLEGEFDLVVVLGGARQSNLDRLRYVAEAIQSGNAKIEMLVIAGSTRKLNVVEQENVSNYAPGAKSEADLCYAAASVVNSESNLPIVVMIVGDEKAGNQAVIEKVMANMPLDSSARVAVVTTQFYQAAAELDLTRVARKHCITDTMAAGNPSDPTIVRKRSDSTYLSEVLRTLRAAVLEATE